MPYEGRRSASEISTCSEPPTDAVTFANKTRNKISSGADKALRYLGQSTPASRAPESFAESARALALRRPQSVIGRSEPS